jgi:hypothetical protein
MTKGKWNRDLRHYSLVLLYSVIKITVPPDISRAGAAKLRFPASNHKAAGFHIVNAATS